nr:class I SAM-dependent methyltransferase [Rhizobiaceae bacterium]
MPLKEKQIDPRKAFWPFRLSAREDVDKIKEEIEKLSTDAQYGWGHTIDFGPFRKDGLLGEHYLQMIGSMQDLGWLPNSLRGQRVADIGCYTGGVSLYFSHLRAAKVFAVDEVLGNLNQCSYLADVFNTSEIETIHASIYDLHAKIERGSLDMIGCFGVLYHLSDMLLGLYIMRDLLTEDGLLLLDTNAVNNAEESYANFGRFYAGMWWQPTTLCVRDMFEFMGFEEIEIAVHE